MNHREVMRQALEALEAGPDVDPIFAGETEDALRAALAEQCQCGDRPAAKCPGAWEPGCDLGANEAHAKVHEPQEPVAWANMKDGEPVLLSISQHPEDRANWMNPVPLYLHPAPQRQPLTEYEAWEIWDALADRGKKGEDIVHAFARAIERAHGIGGQE